MTDGGRVFTDTSDFFAIGVGDEILVEEKRFEVRGDEREYRFGIEDPKFWVKKVLDCQTRERKILKLAYEETFTTHFGGVSVRCFRNPHKESAILRLVGRHASFMKGVTYQDIRGNPVRVLNIVRGANFLNYIGQIRMPHEKYFQTVLPGILHHLVEAFEAVRFLHVHGFRHGDIRNDHLIVTPKSDTYIWIDFDYDFEFNENPFGLDIFGLGNLLVNAVGKGFHNYYMIKNDSYTYGDLKERLTPDDFSLLHKSRLVNLRKLFPYIPPMLNNILLHFSRGTPIFYEDVQEVVEDLNGYLSSV